MLQKSFWRHACHNEVLCHANSRIPNVTCANSCAFDRVKLLNFCESPTKIIKFSVQDLAICCVCYVARFSEG